jgi:hypothetical protein
MDGVTLADLRARRDALDEEIRKAEDLAAADWNSALDRCEGALVEWLHAHSVEYGGRDRKNEVTWDCGHGALTVTFAMDDGEHRPGLRMASGRVLYLEWSEVPEPDRMLAIVAVLLNVSE